MSGSSFLLWLLPGIALTMPFWLPSLTRGRFGRPLLAAANTPSGPPWDAPPGPFRDGAPPGPPPASPPPEPHPASYIVRHWRGELSLPVSYFVNGLGVSLGFVVLSQIVAPALEPHFDPWPALAFTACVWLLAMAVTVWQAVGIWRAAGNHIDRTGRAFWAGVARVLVVIGVASAVARAGTIGWPVLREHVRIALGDTAMGGFELHTLDGGHEIEFAGAIVHGATAALEETLRRTPQARVVRLHSQGGRIGEGRRLQQAIRRAGLDTYVATRCLSACTIAFLGGRNRYIHDKARIGFHPGRLQGIDDAEMREENLRLVEDFVRLGVDRSFATRAWLGPSAELWYPSTAELVRSRFATAIAAGQFALPVMQVDRQHVVDLLRETPLYRAVAEHEPELFARLVEINQDAMRGGMREQELMAQMQALVGPLMGKHLPHASDETLLLYGRTFLAEMKLVTAKGGALACHAHAMGEATAAPFDFEPHLTTAQRQTYLRLRELAITTGATKTGRRLPPAEITPLLDQLWQRLLQRHPPTLIDEVRALQAGTGEKTRTCAVLEIFYGGILEMPPRSAAGLLRYVMWE